MSRDLFLLINFGCDFEGCSGLLNIGAANNILGITGYGKRESVSKREPPEGID
jgi:hypothetical protein